jgi:hypothetical protein
MATLKRMPYRWIRGSTCGALALAGTALLAACTNGPVPAATITYTEASVCTANGGNDPNAPDTLVILVFEITSIGNTSSGATSFTFHPDLLYVSGDNGDDYAATNQSAASGLALAGAPFHFAQTLTVAAGTTKTVNAGVVVTDIVAAGAYDITHSSTIDFHLLYATPSGSEGVLLVKANEGAVKYPTNSDWGCPHYL